MQSWCTTSLPANRSASPHSLDNRRWTQSMSCRCPCPPWASMARPFSTSAGVRLRLAYGDPSAIVCGRSGSVRQPSNGEVVGVSTNRELGYRGDVQHQVLGGVLEAGGEVSRVSGSRDVEASGSASVPYSLRAAWTTHAGYVDFARASARGVSFEAGVRASDSTLMQQHALVPWMLGAWHFGHDWTINASAGASRQFADLDACRARPRRPHSGRSALRTST